MTSNQGTIAERLADARANMTRAERQLCESILSNYPVSGLGSITELAVRAEVSTPTVARMVQKLGFSGYPQFQAEIRAELENVISGPVAKRDTWVTDAPDQHVLNRFTQEVSDNIRRTMEQIDPEEFDRVSALLADPARRIYVVGGRVTGTLAHYLFLHLQMIRSNTVLIPGGSNAWPQYVLDIGPGDVLVVFDVRRYETTTQILAEMAHDKGSEIVLFTDPWRSPITKIAAATLAARIAVPSAWDSSTSTLLLVEALIASVQEASWETVKHRADELEAAFDKSRVFRKFV